MLMTCQSVLLAVKKFAHYLLKFFVLYTGFRGIYKLDYTFISNLLEHWIK